MKTTAIKQAIRDLESQKVAIDAALRPLYALLNGGGAQTPTGRRITAMGAVMAHLRASGEPQTNDQIFDAVIRQGLSTASLHSQMSRRAAKKKDLIHTGRGMWAIAPRK